MRRKPRPLLGIDISSLTEAERLRINGKAIRYAYIGLSAGDLLSAEYRAELEQIESYAGECATCHHTFEGAAGESIKPCHDCHMKKKGAESPSKRRLRTTRPAAGCQISMTESMAATAR